MTSEPASTEDRTVFRFAWTGVGVRSRSKEGSRRQEKVGNSGEGSNDCTRMEDGRLELDQQTGMRAGRQDETAARSSRTADVWRQPGRWGEQYGKDVQG